ncbi:MAG: TraR/DksA C4-type zinc finger protein [Chloroflexi bacterium]|nr:TraR/DksA C4-type zinc finger protein [Chloroflexota bacterium]MDA8189613.1 TraR/DksA C4-type zinc finger protein [Dehalococcoidales bacterium]
MSHIVVTYEALRKQLEEERERIKRDLQQLEREELSREVGPPVEIDTYGNHLADNATDTYEAEKTLALRNHLSGVLDAVEQALQRMENNTYGKCENCDRQIQIERLQALPYTTLCLECKTRLEKEARR